MSISERVRELLREKEAAQKKAEQQRTREAAEQVASSLAAERRLEEQKLPARQLLALLERSSTEDAFRELNANFLKNRGKIVKGSGIPECVYQSGTQFESLEPSDNSKIPVYSHLHDHPKAWVGLTHNYHFVFALIGLDSKGSPVVWLEKYSPKPEHDFGMWQNRKSYFENNLPNEKDTICLDKLETRTNLVWKVDTSKTSTSALLNNGRLPILNKIQEPLAKIFADLL